MARLTFEVPMRFLKQSHLSRSQNASIYLSLYFLFVLFPPFLLLSFLVANEADYPSDFYLLCFLLFIFKLYFVFWGEEDAVPHSLPSS